MLRIAALFIALVFITGSGTAQAAPQLQFSDKWGTYLMAPKGPVGPIGVKASSGTANAGGLLRGNAATLAPGGYIDLDFGQEYYGRIQIKYGAVPPWSNLAVSYSETALHIGDRSDFGPTDTSRPQPGGVWTADKECQFHDSCGNGPRAFRYIRISSAPASGGAVNIERVSVLPEQAFKEPSGWFLSSDDQLNRIWYSSLYTVELMMDTFRRDNVDTRDCFTPLLDGKAVFMDGAKRDRCPFIGDLAVIERTQFVSHGDPTRAINLIRALGQMQHSDGFIPASTSEGGEHRLFDYPAYWVISLANLSLWTGDLSLPREQWPMLVKLLDGWMTTVTGPKGLLQNPYGRADYAYIARESPESVYFNALYIRALESAAYLASSLEQAEAANRWRAKAATLRSLLAPHFWDTARGVFTDAPGGQVHPLDGNAAALLVEAVSPAKAASIFSYINTKMAKPWGNAVADYPLWDGYPWGGGSTHRVYPFISAQEVEARFRYGDDKGALDVLRRVWGWMLNPAQDGTGTAWEAIGNFGTAEGFQGPYSSMASGWSAGAAYLMTEYVLGLQPVTGGFKTWSFRPHPSGLSWSQGAIQTPTGLFKAAWRLTKKGYIARLIVPRGTSGRVMLPANAKSKVVINGKSAKANCQKGYCSVNLTGGDWSVSMFKRN